MEDAIRDSCLLIKPHHHPQGQPLRPLLYSIYAGRIKREKGTLLEKEIKKIRKKNLQF